MKRKICLLLLAVIPVMVSCQEDILELKNENQYGANYFKNEPQFNEAVIAIYSVFLHRGMYSRDYYYIFDLLGNDAERSFALLGDLKQISDFSYGSSNLAITQLWQSLYRMVLRSNLVITKTAQWAPIKQADLDKKKQYEAEARFLRSFAYFHISTLWGRAPLKLSYDSTGVDYVSPRASVEEIQQAVENDLLLAIEGLPVSYPDANIGRATKGAAIALLGKFYLYQKKYAQAIEQLEKLRTAPFSYSLNPSFDAQFSENNHTSNETVFDVYHKKWTDWGEGNAFYMFGGQEGWGNRASHTGRAMEYGWKNWANVEISTAAVQAFKYTDENGNTYTDPRAALTFYGDAPSGGDTDYCDNCAGGARPYPFSENENGYRWRKYQNYEYIENEGLPKSAINSQVIRYADVLLMLAESYIMTGNTSSALPLINQVRSRVGAFTYTSLGSQENAMEILRRERQLELSGEQSRWFDLVRWGIAKQTLNAEKEVQIGAQPVQDKHVWFPIPQLEKNTNPAVARDVANEWN